MIADKLKPGDEIRVVAPSRSLAIVWQKAYDGALDFFEEQGFRLTFSKNAREVNKFQSSSIASRVHDLHEAFADPNVKMIITSLGGFNANQLLPHLDYELIRNNPKLFCGFSDITALLNAIHAMTGLVTYHGPHFSTFGFNKAPEYTRKAFFDCVMQPGAFTATPSEAAGSYTVLQEGCCEGTIIGGNLCTLNLLQGTPYMPDIRNKVLFLEDDNVTGEYCPYEFDRNLQSLLQVSGAETIRGIVFGRFDSSCKLDAETIAEIIQNKVSLDIPVIYGADFGHVFPIFTFPIGGKVKLCAENKKARIQITEH